PRSKGLPLPVGETKTPPALVIGSYVRDRLGLFGKRIKMAVELLQGHPLIDGLRIPQHMQRVGPEIDYALSLFVGDKRVTDVPFGRHSPVERRGSRRHRMNTQVWQQALQVMQGDADAIARQTSTDGKK